MSEIDFGRTAADYARHRAGFPGELFERLAAKVSYSHEAWRGRLLAAEFPDPLLLPHRVFALVAR